MPSYAKSITLDSKTIRIVETLQDELHIENFSQAIRTCIVRSASYDAKKEASDNFSKENAYLKKDIVKLENILAGNVKLFRDIKQILTGKTSANQKVNKLKEIL